MTTLADKSLLSGGDNKPPMLEKHLYDSWKSRMELYMMNRPHGRMILASVEKGPLVWPTITVDGVTRPKEYTELTPAETIQADCDIKAINIILQFLPTEIYALVSQHLNTKFLNTLPAEWSKFVTDVKLVKDLHTTNVDQINAHLEQHERHANEVRLMHERNSNPLALVASHQITQSLYQSHQHSYQNSQHQQFVSLYQSSQYGSPFESQQYSINQSPTPHSITYPPNNYQTSVHHNVYSLSSSIPQIEYSPTVNQQSKFPQLDSGLTILVFKHGDDPIDAINHVMSFLSAIVTSRYPTTNNQLRNSSNPRQQATINDGRVHIALAEVHNPDNVNNNLINQAVQEMSSSEQSNVVNYSETEITSDRNIICLFSVLVNCTKINLENKSVNDTLSAELERYKDQVKVLKKGQNVDLNSKDNVLDSCAQSVEIDLLKQTLSEHLKEKESLMQTVTLLKNDFKKEESRNVGRA
ncbi:hypothetical protein Tco_0551613 [Tanacetum coccineum]